MGKKLYVGNLSYGVTDSDLQQMFAATKSREPRGASAVKAGAGALLFLTYLKPSPTGGEVSLAGRFRVDGCRVVSVPQETFFDGQPQSPSPVRTPRGRASEGAGS